MSADVGGGEAPASACAEPRIEPRLAEHLGDHGGKVDIVVDAENGQVTADLGRELVRLEVDRRDVEGVAMAEARRITSSEHMGIMGGSNDGRLVGAAFTQRPDLFGAVACQVPLLDMKRYHTRLAGASCIPRPAMTACIPVTRARWSRK